MAVVRAPIGSLRRRGARPASIVTLGSAIGCSVAIMGLRDREIQVISSGLMQRVVESDEDPSRAMGLVAREGQGSWSFARSQGQDGKVRTGYVMVYFAGVAWVTAESLAKHPSHWGSNDISIPADSIVGASVSLPRGSPAAASWSHVQSLTAGQGTLRIETKGGSYLFTHLEDPLAFNVAQELDGLLSVEPASAGIAQKSHVMSDRARTYEPGDEVNGHVLTKSGRWVPLSAVGKSGSSSSPSRELAVKIGMGVVWIGVVGWLLIGTVLGVVVGFFYLDPPLSTALGPIAGIGIGVALHNRWLRRRSLNA